MLQPLSEQAKQESRECCVSLGSHSDHVFKRERLEEDVISRRTEVGITSRTFSSSLGSGNIRNKW